MEQQRDEPPHQQDDSPHQHDDDGDNGLPTHFGSRPSANRTQIRPYGGLVREAIAHFTSAESVEEENRGMLSRVKQHLQLTNRYLSRRMDEIAVAYQPVVPEQDNRPLEWPDADQIQQVRDDAEAAQMVRDMRNGQALAVYINYMPEITLSEELSSPSDEEPATEDEEEEEDKSESDVEFKIEEMDDEDYAAVRSDEIDEIEFEEQIAKARVKMAPPSPMNPRKHRQLRREYQKRAMQALLFEDAEDDDKDDDDEEDLPEQDLYPQHVAVSPMSRAINAHPPRTSSMTPRAQEQNRLSAQIAMKALEKTKLTFDGSAEADIYAFDRDLMHFVQIHGLADDTILQLIMSGIMITGVAHQRLSHANPGAGRGAAEQIAAIRRWLKTTYDRAPRVEYLRGRLSYYRQGSTDCRAYREQWMQRRDDLKREIEIQIAAGREYVMMGAVQQGRTFCAGMNDTTRKAVQRSVAEKHSSMDQPIGVFVKAVQEIERVALWHAQFARPARSSTATHTINQAEVQETPQPTCRACRGVGHIARDCPENTRRRRGQPPAGAAQTKCRHGAQCRFRAKGMCWFNHDADEPVQNASAPYAAIDSTN